MTSLKSFSASIDMLDPVAPDGVVSLQRCLPSNSVCLIPESSNYFFFYSCLLTDAHVRFPFGDFSISVLHALNVASCSFIRIVGRRSKIFGFFVCFLM